MVSNVHGGFALRGDLRSLTVRFEEKLNELEKVAPNANYGGPRTELTLVELTGIVDRHRAAKAPTSQINRWVMEKRSELYEARAAYHKDWMAVAEMQPIAQRLAHYWQHRLLGSLDQKEVFTKPVLVDPSESRDWIVTEQQGDKAIAETKAQHDRLRVHWLEPMKAAMHFENQPPEQQNRELIKALFLKMEVAR